MELTPRDLLFGDRPLDAWPGGETAHGEPWETFRRARARARAGDRAGAVEALKSILAMAGLESRHYAQAWHFLRMAGVSPTGAEGKRVLGVVVEVGVNEGQDLVAAYADRSARYFNFSGAAVIWEHPDASLDAPVTALVEAGEVLAARIGPWEGARPPPVQRGEARVNLICPCGLHFGQGPFETLAHDQLGGPLIHRAGQLMQALIAKSEQRRAGE
jgi:hypothetical protein